MAGLVDAKPTTQLLGVTSGIEELRTVSTLDESCSWTEIRRAGLARSQVEICLSFLVWCRRSGPRSTVSVASCNFGLTVWLSGAAAGICLRLVGWTIKILWPISNSSDLARLVMM